MKMNRTMITSGKDRVRVNYVLTQSADGQYSVYICPKTEGWFESFNRIFGDLAAGPSVAPHVIIKNHDPEWIEALKNALEGRKDDYACARSLEIRAAKRTYAARESMLDVHLMLEQEMKKKNLLYRF